MLRMIEETNRRRTIQLAYNEEHGIVPRTVLKSREEILRGTVIAEQKYEEGGPTSYRYDEGESFKMAADPVVKYLTPEQRQDLMAQLQAEMLEAAENLEFERAAELRDNLEQLRKAAEA
jgi:excinuclease ABC subunit B